MIVYIMLTNDKYDELQPKIIDYISKNLVDSGLKSSNLHFKFVFNPEHIIEHKLPKFQNIDIILWHPSIAGSNLEIMKQYVNSIVILQKKTILLQKISKNNPITENMSINHEFKILYMDAESNDITNDDYQLVIAENHYTIKIEKLIELINQNIKN